MAFSITTLGTGQNSRTADFFQITSISASAGDWIFVFVAGEGNDIYGVVAAGFAAGGGTLNLTKLLEKKNTNVTGQIWGGKVVYTNAAGYVQVSTYVSTTAKSAAVIKCSGIVLASPVDRTASAIGTSDSPSSGATAQTTSLNEILLGFVATFGPDGDTAGTWGADVDQNTQRLGTTGGGNNVTISSAAELVSSIGTYTASKTGITSQEWAAGILTIKEASAKSNLKAYMNGGGQPSSSTSAFMEGDGNDLGPDSDITVVGTWKNELGGTTLYLSLGETTPDDSDFAIYENAVLNDYFEVGLSSPGEPSESEGIFVQWRAGIDGDLGVLKLKCELRQGANVLASDEHYLTTTIQDFSFFASGVTDFDDLRIRITITEVA